MSAAVLRTPEAAKYIGLSQSTMTKMRLRGGGDVPPFVKLGPRCIGYCVADLDRWLEARRRASTSDATGSQPTP
jgi:predicted DNA-binding transcriptional regulator AlpA